VAADSDEEAWRLFTTQQQAFVNLRRGQPGLVPPPLESGEAIAAYCSADELRMLERTLACRAVGAPSTVRAPDELIITANIFDHALRIRSFERVMEAWTQATQGYR
jgi:hypothetical protein